MIKSRSRFLPLKPSTLPSWGRFSIILAVRQLLSIPFPPHPEPPIGEAVEPSFLQHHSTSLRRYHFLPIFQSLLSHWGQCSAWLGGESWGRKFLLLMLSYFGNLVAFCLFFKNFLSFLFYSPWLLRRNFQIEMGEIEFLSFYLT